MGNRVRKPPWLIALWSIVPVVLACVSIPFIAVAIIGFECRLVFDVFRVYWLVFLLIIVFVFILMLLVFKYPAGTISTGLLLIAFLLLIASAQENEIAQQLRSIIHKTVELDFVVGAITLLAFALAFSRIYKGKQIQD